MKRLALALLVVILVVYPSGVAANELPPLADSPSDQSAPVRAAVRQPSSVAHAGRTADIRSELSTGVLPWAVVLCRYAGNASTPQPRSWFEGLMGSTAPGMRSYFLDQSYGATDIAGTTVFGWYNLPQPQSYYVVNDQPNLDQLARDCTQAANADVHFPSFYGIVVWVNGSLGCCAWGGGVTLARDGQTKTYAAAWMAGWTAVENWAGHAYVAHEMGHGFGMQHSKGAGGGADGFDAMTTCDPPDEDYGCVSSHFLAYTKMHLGWIEASSQYRAETAGTHEVTLDAISNSFPQNDLVAVIPTGSGTFYTVEARAMQGYDVGIPGEGIVIHHVVPGRPEPAHQIHDGTADDSADPGAIWTAGESYVDSGRGITVTIGSQISAPYGDSWNVTIHRDEPFGTVSNDNFTDAESISTLPFVARTDTSDATIEAGEPHPASTCNPPVANSVWFSYRSPTKRVLVVSTKGSSFDTILAIYRGSTMGNLARVACDDDALGRQSRVRFTAKRGVTYWFQVGGYSGASGDLILRVKR